MKGVLHNNKIAVEKTYCPLMKELCDELSKKDVMKRMQELPTLGVSYVGRREIRKRDIRTRMEYVKIQEYLNNLIKAKLTGKLEYSGNKSIFREFNFGEVKVKKNDVTMYAVMQILILSYNIGHYYDTFISSMAITMASRNTSFRDFIINSFGDERFKIVATQILNSEDYLHVHLLNSLVILEKCDKNKASVIIAKEIIYKYLCDMENNSNEINYLFFIFKKIRTVVYMSFDFPVSKMPLRIEINDDVVNLMEEMLSQYNDKKYSDNMILALNKFLSDRVNNANSDVIVKYDIAKQKVNMVSYSVYNSYYDMIMDSMNVLNLRNRWSRDFLEDNILKLTFTKDEMMVAKRILSILDNMNNTRVGYYNRHMGETTIVLSIRKNCEMDAKRKTALKCTRVMIRELRSIHANIDDKRYLLVAKFFMYHLFGDHRLRIEGTISNETCVLCIKGNVRKAKEIKKLLNASKADGDKKHEIEFLLDYIEKDSFKDVSILIPARIVVYKKDNKSIQNEFDGLIVHPNRCCKQVVFLESKNTRKGKIKGKNCLKEKFENLNIRYDEKDIKIMSRDAYMEYTI